MFYTNLVPALAYAPALAFMPLPGAAATPWLLALTTLGPVGVYAGIVAVKHASAAMLGPYTLLRLVLGVAAGVVLFHELPDILSALGAVIIICSCALSSGLIPFGVRQHPGRNTKIKQVPAPLPRRHPKLAAPYRQRVELLHEELNRPELRAEAA
jgi:hypothetical protein